MERQAGYDWAQVCSAPEMGISDSTFLLDWMVGPGATARLSLIAFPDRRHWPGARTSVILPISGHSNHTNPVGKDHHFEPDEHGENDAVFQRES